MEFLYTLKVISLACPHFPSILFNSTAQHSTAQHSTAQHSTAQHSTQLHFSPSSLEAKVNSHITDRQGKHSSATSHQQQVLFVKATIPLSHDILCAQQRRPGLDACLYLRFRILGLRVARCFSIRQAFWCTCTNLDTVSSA